MLGLSGLALAWQNLHLGIVCFWVEGWAYLSSGCSKGFGYTLALTKEKNLVIQTQDSKFPDSDRLCSEPRPFAFWWNLWSIRIFFPFDETHEIEVTLRHQHLNRCARERPPPRPWFVGHLHLHETGLLLLRLSVSLAFFLWHIWASGDHRKEWQRQVRASLAFSSSSGHW